MDQKLDVFHQNGAGTSFLSRAANEGAQNNRSNICSGIRENIGNFLSGCKSTWKYITTPIPEDEGQDALVYDFNNARQDRNPKSIGAWLERFEVPEILTRLEKSLEKVKRNKISKKEHEELSESVDKELRSLSLTFHPDQGGNPEWQSALNATRKVLKTLTVVFLENLFVDYKYEYFSRLDISVLVNENEINKTTQAIFYKISVLSETKRMNIIGEIRKFLAESEICVKSYFDDRKEDFEKHRNYAFYHLQKNVLGYKKLEKECSLIIEECRKENDSMRAAVESMVNQIVSELRILSSLELVARQSFKGHFEIFSVNKTMDEYYILPFVDYVNVLSICNFLLQPKWLRLSPKSFCFESEQPPLFTQAYKLMSNIYSIKRGIIKTKNRIDEYKIELHEVLEKIFNELQMTYKVDAYNEGKSNREEMYEKLSDLKKLLGSIQEKERDFEERVNRYKMAKKESSQSVVNNCSFDTKESFTSDMTKQEKSSEKESNKFSFHMEKEGIVKKSCRKELSTDPPEEGFIKDSKVGEKVAEDYLNPYF